ncbi:MAG TPA: heparinase II/III family protein, partial [Magnetospirillum sp.]|nr:heparinase II/III family protein [Magnetospirillum sp.]
MGAKLVKLKADPVLRRWLWLRLLGRAVSPAPFTPHRPPYFRPPAAEPARAPDLPALEAGMPQGSLTLPVPGGGVTVEAGRLDLFSRPYADGEALSALHRFAWLPLMPDVDGAWVAALWQAWCEGYGHPQDGPAWEAYTAAERVINILDFACRRGLPGERDATIAALAAHGPAMIERLEYYGEQGTCNHLANNGRGLYRLGLELGLADTARLGLDILVEEAQRLFLPSGVLREASTHYHLLYLRNYVDCWLAARRHGRSEVGWLAALAQRFWTVLPHFALPGGMPLMGDISPDSPPAFLAGLFPGAAMEQGWTGLLSSDERAALGHMRDGIQPADAGLLAVDGWLRGDFGRWSALWHGEPAGWRLPTGHGHEDLGAAEIHLDGIPLFVDSGRGAYGESGEAALYLAAAVHGTLQVDGHDPFPANKPYYDEPFRGAMAGAPPVLARTADGLELAHGGFMRLSGVGMVRRRHAFDQTSLLIEDTVEGKGRRRLTRRLVTPHAVRAEGSAVLIEAPNFAVRVSAEVPLACRPMKRWLAYGEAAPAFAIEANCTVALP